MRRVDHYRDTQSECDVSHGNRHLALIADSRYSVKIMRPFGDGGRARRKTARCFTRTEVFHLKVFLPRSQHDDSALVARRSILCCFIMAAEGKAIIYFYILYFLFRQHR